MKRIGNRELTVLLAVGALTLVAGAVAILVDARPEWKYYQTEFRDILEEKSASSTRPRFPPGSSRSGSRRSTAWTAARPATWA